MVTGKANEFIRRLAKTLAQAVTISSQTHHILNSSALQELPEPASTLEPPTPLEESTPSERSKFLPMARLITAAHTDDGISNFSSDASVPQSAPFGPDGPYFTVFDARCSIPINNMEPPKTGAPPMCPPSGAIFFAADIPPGGSVPTHHTQTLDYCTVLSGEVVIGLDDGEEKIVKAGDFIIQQGVKHEWLNRSSESCRILFVMLGAEQVQLRDGRILEQSVA